MRTDVEKNRIITVKAQANLSPHQPLRTVPDQTLSRFAQLRRVLKRRHRLQHSLDIPQEVKSLSRRYRLIFLIVKHKAQIWNRAVAQVIEP